MLVERKEIDNNFMFLSFRLILIEPRLVKAVGSSFKCMNEEKKINFAYIAGKHHGRVDITPEQLNQVMKILYG